MACPHRVCPIFDFVYDFLHGEALERQERLRARYLKPDLLIIDDMRMKQLPVRSGEHLFEIVMPRHERRTMMMMTRNRPLEDWGKLICDVTSARAIPDWFLNRAELLQIMGHSNRLNRSAGNRKNSRSINVPTGFSAE
ncbi:MAG: ATP-binding protein [Planctomycetaceae bacterium]|nr:ATP-binding protein [Planctomycetaceae bacterium]